ncbi:hypothetical protein [Sulfurisphaera tokodaii]|uniref:Uncharacterized protein n=2 Tax=Sulfurisphaera tokodaii TaxID=111955 RepID=Q96Z84_SULTO|nr:hypothetical protein [Sulfurisphaera tokodaii]BAB67042.1 hypothetical protein STK_19470 [Sulfurisphaera tokodaii str. 7]HII74481.1 hypothetical protein [Sulfurisphaera tokodaii]
MAENYFTDTLRDLLDSLILQLSLDDSKKLSDHPIYLYLYDLVYGTGSSTKVVGLSSPYYPYLIVAYHLLFVKKQKDKAVQLFNKIHDEFTGTNGIKFSYDEKKMYEVLNEVFKRIISINYSKEVCDEMRKMIDNIDIDEFSYAYFFKSLILIQLGSGNIDNAQKEFEHYKNFLMLPVNDEIAEHFDIISKDPAISRIVDYLDKEFKRVKSDYEKLNNEIDKLRKEINDLKDKHSKIDKYTLSLNNITNNLIPLLTTLSSVISSSVLFVIYRSLISIITIIPLIIIIGLSAYDKYLAKQTKKKENEMYEKEEKICKCYFDNTNCK